MTILETALAAYLGVLGAAATAYAALAITGYTMGKRRAAKRKVVLDGQLARIRAAAAEAAVKNVAADLPDTGNVNEEYDWTQEALS